MVFYIYPVENWSVTHFCHHQNYEPAPEIAWVGASRVRNRTQPQPASDCRLPTQLREHLQPSANEMKKRITWVHAPPWERRRADMDVCMCARRKFKAVHKKRAGAESERERSPSTNVCAPLSALAKVCVFIWECVFVRYMYSPSDEEEV